MRIIRVGEKDSQYSHLSKATWGCPQCREGDVVHYDIEKAIFICFNCCKTFSLSDGKKIFDGFEGL